MTVSLIMNRGDKVTEVLLDSIKMKPNDNNIVDAIENSLTNEHEDTFEKDEEE